MAGLNQNGFSRLELGIVEQHVLHGAERHRCAGGVAIAHAVWNGNDEPRRHIDQVAGEAVDMEAHDAGDIFAEIVAAFTACLADAAGQCAIGNDAIADPARGHIGAHGGDFSRRLHADDQRQRALGEGHAAPAPNVDMV